MLTREIPAVTKNLLIINSIMFIATWVTENMGIDLTGLLGLHFFWLLTSTSIRYSPTCSCMVASGISS